MRIVKPITITDSNLISSNVPEKDAQVFSKLVGKNLKDRVMVLSNHTIYEVQKQETSAVTISQGSPAIVTWNNHGLANGRMVTFSSSGTLPTGITAGTTYYVINATQNTFQVSTKDPYFTRASVGTYFDANGVLQTAPVNALRISYDPSDLTAPSNVLVEPAAANYIKYSQQMDNTSAWGDTNLGTTIDFGLAPDGTTSAERLIAATTAGAHYKDQEIFGLNYSNGDLYTYSVYLKANTLERVRLDMYYAVGSTGGYNAIFNLRTGLVEVKSPDIREAYIQALPNGWYRCILVGLVSYATTYPTRLLTRILLLRNGDNNSSWAGTGDEGVLAWGAQLEKSDKSSSYIKTTGAAVTRAADIIADTPSFGTAVNTSTAGSGTHTALALVNNLDPVLNPTYWLNVGATNRWKMFDKAVQSQTLATTSLVAKIKPTDRVDTIPLINLKGTTLNVAVTNPTYGSVFNQTIPLLTDSEPVVDMSSYLYAGFTQRTEVVVEDIPPYANNEITLTVSATEGTQVGIGAAVFGQARDISSTGLGVEQGARFGIDDYSIKTRDSFGNYVITERAFSDKANVTVFVNNSELSSIKNFLTSLRATPVVFIGSKKWDYLTIYGFYKNWEVDVAYPDFSVLSMEVSGLT